MEDAQLSFGHLQKAACAWMEGYENEMIGHFGLQDESRSYTGRAIPPALRGCELSLLFATVEGMFARGGATATGPGCMTGYRSGGTSEAPTARALGGMRSPCM